MGMTLLEVSVALALFSLLAIGLLTAFRIGQRTFAQVQQMSAQSQDLLTTGRMVRTLIESAAVSDASTDAPAGDVGLRGSADELALTAPAPMSVGGLYRYRFALQPRADGVHDLVVRTISDWGVNVHELPAKEMMDILVSNVRAIHWSYRAAPVREASGRLVDSPWQSSWNDPRHPPALVSLDIAFPQGDSRRWPQLLVATRATDSGLCVFDVVAQGCPGAGT